MMIGELIATGLSPETVWGMTIQQARAVIRAVHEREKRLLETFAINKGVML